MKCETAIKTYKNGNQILEVFYDETPLSPREDTNLGIMMCGHKQYDLGDIQVTAENYEEKLEEAKKDAYHMMPIYMFDHSGLTLSTDDTKFRAVDHQGWDWGQVGYIYTTPEKIKEIFGDETPSKERIEEIFEEELKFYTQYLNGSVYGYNMSKLKTCSFGEEHKEEIDSCWGFYNIEDIFSQIPENNWKEVK